MKYLSKHWIWVLAAIVWMFVLADFRVSPTLTPSMEPTFKVGRNWQLIVPIKFESPDIGDIIAFYCVPEKCGPELISHRLVKVDENKCFYILGDNQPNAWDTNDYGCLMPEEIYIQGVVHKLF